MSWLAELLLGLTSAEFIHLPNWQDVKCFALALQVKYSLSRQSDGNLIWYIYGEFASVEDYNKHASQQYEHVSLCCGHKHVNGHKRLLLFAQLSSRAAVATSLAFTMTASQCTVSSCGICANYTIL